VQRGCIWGYLLGRLLSTYWSAQNEQYLQHLIVRDSVEGGFSTGHVEGYLLGLQQDPNSGGHQAWPKVANHGCIDLNLALAALQTDTAPAFTVQLAGPPGAIPAQVLNRCGQEHTS
jgi:hypothetical protein